MRAHSHNNKMYWDEVCEILIDTQMLLRCMLKEIELAYYASCLGDTNTLQFENNFREILQSLRELFESYNRSDYENVIITEKFSAFLLELSECIEFVCTNGGNWLAYNSEHYTFLVYRAYSLYSAIEREID